jgi:hypothetical protein
MCPKCGEAFEHTQCHACEKFSPHKDWYHARGGDRYSLDEELEFDAPQKVEF